MPLIPFPNVPALPGVPALPRSLAAAVSVISGLGSLLTADDPGILGLVAEPSWGIFDASGAPALTADSAVSLELTKEYDVPDYPVEEGAFASYNKVERPYEHRVVLAKGGSEAARAAFIQQLEAIEASTDLFSVYTPERIFESCNIVGHRVKRSARSGAQLLQVEISVKQIRQASSAAFTSTQSPAGAAQQNGGTVQPQAPSAAQAAAAANGST